MQKGKSIMPRRDGPVKASLNGDIPANGLQANQANPAEAAPLPVGDCDGVGVGGEVHIFLEPGYEPTTEDIARWEAASDYEASMGDEDDDGACEPAAAPALKMKGNKILKLVTPVLQGAVYHGPAGRFVRAVSPLTEATDVGVLAQLLCALGVYIGPEAYIWTSGKQYARVNVCLVGQTKTGRKGTAMVPVDLAMMALDEEFWKAQRMSGLATGEGLIKAVADIKTKNPETGEWEVEPVEKRVMVVESEFSKVLAQMTREGNILSQVIRDAYDSTTLQKMTASDPMRADGAHVGMAFHITPYELRKRFKDTDMANGFGNRIMWLLVKSDKIISRTQPFPQEIFTAFKEEVKHLAKPFKGRVELAPDVQDRWDNIYPLLRADKDGAAGEIIARAENIILRLALIYRLLDPPTCKHQCFVEMPHLDAALALWWYAEESAQLIFADSGGSFLADRLIDLLKAGPLSKDQINNHLSADHKQDADAELLKLAAAGIVSKKQEPSGKKGGRPATVWELVL
jgi:hypothetical protein